MLILFWSFYDSQNNRPQRQKNAQYDNNTPDDRSNDIFVVADKFWERLSLGVVQYDEAGQLIE